MPRLLDARSSSARSPLSLVARRSSARRSPSSSSPARRRNSREILAETRTGAPAGASASSSASRPSSISPSGLPAVASCSLAAASGASQSEQRRGFLAAEAADPDGRQVRAVEQRGLALTNREQHRDRISHQPSDGEQQRLGAGAVEPLGVVDQHGDRALLGVGGEQAERRRADREALLRPGRPERERALERERLRLRDAVEHPERRAQQLEQRRERDLRL